MYIYNIKITIKRKSSESCPAMRLCDREKDPIIGGRWSWKTSKKNKLAFTCLS